MGSPIDDSFDESEEPWSDEGGRRSASRSGHQAPSPAQREVLADGDNWGIPGLELTATVRPDKSVERTAEEERALAEARRRVVNSILPEVLNRAEALRGRIGRNTRRPSRRGGTPPSRNRRFGRSSSSGAPAGCAIA